MKPISFWEPVVAEICQCIKLRSRNWETRHEEKRQKETSAIFFEHERDKIPLIIGQSQLDCH